MATIELAIRAIFQGRENLKAVSDSLRQIRDELDRMDQKGAEKGEVILSRFDALRAAADGFGTAVKTNMQGNADAMLDYAATMRVAAAAAAELGDTARARDFFGEAEQAEARARGILMISNAINELGVATKSLPREQIISFLQGLENVGQTGKVLGDLAIREQEAGRAALEAGQNLEALGIQTQRLSNIQSTIGTFRQMASSFQLGAKEIAAFELRLTNAAYVLEQFTQKSAGAGAARLAEGFSQTITSLREYEAQARRASAAAAAMGNEKAATTFMMQANAIKTAKDNLIQYNLQLSRTGQVITGLSREDIFQRLRGKTGPQQILDELRTIREEGRRAIREGFTTEGLAGIFGGQETLSNAESLIKMFRDLAIASGASKKELLLYEETIRDIDNAHRQTPNSAGLFLKQLNLIGFSIFITISSIRTIIGLIKDFGGVIEDAAGQIAKLQAFNAVMRQFGQSGVFLGQAIKDASGGLLDMQSTQEATLRLLKASIPEYETTSVMLARLAANSAKVSGDLSKTSEIYEKLVKGIVRGSPRLIDDADIVLKLGNAYEKYAESIGKSTDELSEREQQLAVVSALEEEAIRMEELASAVGELPTEPIQRFKNELSELGRTAQRVGGILVTEILRQMYAIDNASKQLTMDEALEKAEANAAKFERALARASEAMETGTVEQQYAALDNLVEKLPPIEKSLFQVGTVITMVVRGIGALSDSLGHFLTAFVNLPLYVGQAVNQALGGTQNILNFFRATALEAKESWLELRDAIPGGEDVTQELQQTRNELSLVRDQMAALKEAAPSLEEALKGALEKVNNELELGAEAWNEYWNAFGKEATVAAALDVLRSMGIEVEVLKEKIEAADPGALAWIDDQIKQLENYIGAQGKFTRDVQRVWRDHAEQVFEINQDLNESLAELFDERVDKALEIEEDFSKTIKDINKDLQEDLDDNEEDYQKKREKEKEKHDKNIENLEERHQNKIDQILRRFELARLKALIDRDARALFEAEERKRQELLEAEKEEAQDKRKEEERHKEELDDLREQEEEKAAELREQARKKREEARQQRQEELDELDEWYADATQREVEAAEDRRNQAKLSAVRRIRDLQENLQETERMEDASNILRKLQELRELGEREGNTKEFIDTMKDLRDELQTYYDQNPIVFPPIVFDKTINSITALTPPGGNGPIPIVTAPPTTSPTYSTAPSNITQAACISTDAPIRVGPGAPCFGSNPNQTYCASDGSIWKCIGGGWVYISGGLGSASLYGPPKSAPPTFSSFGAPVTTTQVQPGFTGPAGNGQTMNIVLQTADPGLNAILDGAVNNAYVELLGS